MWKKSAEQKQKIATDKKRRPFTQCYTTVN